MKLGILNSEAYFNQTEDGKWEYITPYCYGEQINNDDVIEILNEYADCLNEEDNSIGIDLNREDEPEVQILNKWLNG